MVAEQQRKVSLPDEERRRLGIYATAVSFFVGSFILVTTFLVPIISSRQPETQLAAMGIGALIAFPAAMAYLTIPRLLDRYDPEPWSMLCIALAWGGIVAPGIAAVLNSSAHNYGFAISGPTGATMASTVLSAPIVEEFLKGIGVAGVFYFGKREFDGIVDGIIYATFVGIGFAATENVLYYGRALQESQDALAITVLVRGVLSPWIHPLYTSMIGIGFGIARETRNPSVRTIAPFLGFLIAVTLHLIWNASATYRGGVPFLILLPLWLLFVGTFFVMVVILVWRKGQIIRKELEIEVELGTITPTELDLVTSPFGSTIAMILYGRLGQDFFHACARLALHRWHASRAEREGRNSMSPLFVEPLRQRIQYLRRQYRAAERQSNVAIKTNASTSAMPAKTADAKREHKSDQSQ